MTGKAQIAWMPDGRRLHLHHGPIDMIVSIEGPERKAGFARAARRFETLLEELVAELPLLRSPPGAVVAGEAAQKMAAATRPFAPRFITPMAAVAGAGADTILAAVCAGPGIDRAYVNNGGDVALHIGPGQRMTAANPAAPLTRIVLCHADRPRGVATSGWRGRSHSLGIADAVTVLAATAAAADAAATMICNAVDLPGHPAIARIPAHDLFPDSDLGPRPVTAAVGPLTPAEVSRALDAGAAFARNCLDRGLIHAALLSLQGRERHIATFPYLQPKEYLHARLHPA